MRAARVLFHVQHLLGIGHVTRAAALTRAMRGAGIDVTVLSGGEPVAGVDFAGEILQLPPARAFDASFKTLVDDAGCVLDDAFHRRRRRLVEGALAAARPDLVLIESYPFGRRAFRRELEPLLASGVPVAVSIRDVLVAKDARRNGEAIGIVRQNVAAVLVHGDRRFLRLEDSFPEAAEIADKVRYTGYVYEAPRVLPASPAGEVVVSAGGGAVGQRLLSTALAARPLTRFAAAPWRLVGGPNLPEDARRSLSAALPDGVVLERFRSDFPALLRRCAVSVSQAGYNTVLDLLHARPPCVLVPFAAAGETEQALRARRLAAAGGVKVVDEAALTPAALAAAIDAAGPPALELDMAGAARTAEFVNLMFKEAS